jgi:hypothetical protein
MGAEINQNLPDEIGHFGCWMLQCWEIVYCYMSVLVFLYSVDRCVFACFNPHLSFGIDVL